jgi:hypothetical protein
MCCRNAARKVGEMAASSRSSGGRSGLGTVFWILLSIVVVGLVLMIVLPLAGR